jgi:hypothetical protein
MKPKAAESRQLTPPFWAGCGLFAWLRLLARNHFAIDRSRWPLAAICTASSAIQSALGLIQNIVHGRDIANTRIRNAPVFVLGHWRSGTTLLHEMLARDPRLAAPTTFDCFNPNHFVLTRNWLPGLFQRFAPSRRPMDSMAAGLERPQEDEFALLLLGQPSPYEWIAFPRLASTRTRNWHLGAGQSSRQKAWERTFRWLFQALTLVNRGQRLVLKSPPHSARIPTLLKLFPDARFIHLVRDPYAVYSSTLHLWRTLFAAHGLQESSWKGLDEHVLGTFAHLHQAFEETRGLIPQGRLHELRYEELVGDPIACLESAYRSLELGELNPALNSMKEYLLSVRGYEPSSHMLTVEEYRAINAGWEPFFKQYGYEMLTR